MTGVLEQLADDAAHGQVPVSQLLRRAKLISRRRGNPSVDDWIEHESSGYPNELEIPRYRVLAGIPQGHWVNHGWRSLRLGNEEKMNAAYSIIFYNHSITEVESLASDSQGEGSRLSLPEFLEVAVTNQNVGMDKAGVFIARGKFKDLLDAVRTRVMDWAQELEGGDVTEDKKSTAADGIHNTYNFYDGARMNQQNNGSGDNIIVEGSVFGDLRTRISQGVANEGQRQAMLQAVSEMEATKNTPGFVEHYQRLIGLAADHIGVIQWALPALAFFMGAGAG
ncbi:hypothetical protein [Brevundimonas sp.]|jgi:hypothetical protein|uniref:AbiTii domain-containing protein n=1 Tax=Brevundimonas sp. TaxID=1871086 RepID=UPI0037C16226